MSDWRWIVLWIVVAIAMAILDEWRIARRIKGRYRLDRYLWSISVTSFMWLGYAAGTHGAFK